MNCTKPFSESIFMLNNNNNDNNIVLMNSHVWKTRYFRLMKESPKGHFLLIVKVIKALKLIKQAVLKYYFQA